MAKGKECMIGKQDGRHEDGETLEEQKNAIEPGMSVEASGGDLGEEDVSKPKVADVVRDAQGEVEEIIVQKGLLFKKELEIPADRIQEVKGDGVHGVVKVDASEREIEGLTAIGREQLVEEKEFEEQERRNPLDAVEEAIPTAEGLRQREQEAEAFREASPEQQQEEVRRQLPKNKRFAWLSFFGPGLLGGMAGNDSSAVAAYAIDGAQNGFGHLWLLLLATPLYQAVMFTCAKLGRVTQKGFAQVIREFYSPWLAGIASLTLIIANVALIAADLVAIGSGLQLIFHIDWAWFVVPVALLLWYITVFRNFESFKQIFIIMSLVFVVYLVTAVLSKPDWSAVAFNTFVPHINLDFASVSSAVALLGATISPYNIFWQVQGEKEEIRPGNTKQQLRLASFDIGTGVVSGNLIAYAIIVSTAATLYVRHKSIVTAADAAQALSPVLGPFATYLFAIGLIGAGVVAIPVLLASTSYAVAGTFGWPSGLSKKPWQSEGFYLILTLALLASLVAALLRLDPISLLFWANVLSGVLAPVLVFFLFLIVNNKKIMGNQRLSLFTNVFLVLTLLVEVVTTALLFYGLATGQG